MPKTNIIKEIIKKPPNNYEAYLYRYINEENGKIYVGIHKGSVDDPYNHSSTNLEFAKVFVDSNSKLIFEVISYGTWIEMQNAEYNILHKVDARNNPDYYNKSNGFPQYVEPNRDKVLALLNQIRDGLYPTKKEPLHLHEEMAWLQVRYQHLEGLQKIIKQKIDDANGNTDNCNPVIVYVARGPNGEDMRGDGNHTVFGASQSKHAVDIPVIRIPYEVHCLYTDAELKILGRYLNKRPEVVKSPFNVPDGIKHILDNAENGVPYNSNSNVQFLKDFGLTGSLGKGEIKTATDKAKQILDEKYERDTSGRLFINYKALPYSTVLKEKVNKFGAVKGQCSIFMSSAKFSIERILETLFSNQDCCDRIMVVIHHPTVKQSVLWKKNGQPFWLNLIASSGMKWKISFHEMDMWAEDMSTDSKAA